MWTLCILSLFLAAVLISRYAAAQNANREPVGQPLLMHSSTLIGARINAHPDPLIAVPRGADFFGYLPWIAPAAVAARGNYLYVADSGRRKIFRYDQAQQNMTPFADYAAGATANIAVAADLSLYVADINAQKVLHYSVDGRLLRAFGSAMEIARPVAVLVDEVNGRLFVADSLYNHVVVFNSLGRVLSVLQSDESRSIEAMTGGPDGLYLVDRIGRQIVVIGLDGRDRYTLGTGVLKNPGAIAVDRFNRVFVSDSFDNTIKIFEDGEMVAVFAGGGAAPAAFNRITGLWLEQNMLYVADSLNARIQAFRIAPPEQKVRAHD